ncbi:MAG: DUF6036 family nucleotidyltransferase [Candidatus Limnocylindrales bacterium]
MRALAHELGRLATSPHRLYLVGGATAVMEGWRQSTIDIDLRLEPDSDELLRAIPQLKETLGINIELASPPDFIPELPGWRDRSPFLLQEGQVSVHHFDFYSQALSKIERDIAQDREDVASMLETGVVESGRLLGFYEAIEPLLFRYPAIDPPSFRRRVERAARA